MNHTATFPGTFLATICHELRNPISAVIACADLLEKDYDLSNEERVDFLQSIKVCGAEALKLVEDIMAISKYNADHFSVDLSQKIDINEIIDRCINLKKIEAAQTNITIINNNTGSELLANLDPIRIKQVLVNLISNSIKYSPAWTQISIEAKIKDKQLEISVTDQGFGMNEDEIELSLKPYQTIKNPNSDKVDAFGLGLPCVKELVELQNGKMIIESEKNRGTKVKMVFGELVWL